MRKPSKRNNILLINQPLNNRGDESAHKALVRTLLNSITNADIQVVFVDKNQDSIEQFRVKNARVSYINVRHSKGWFRYISFCAKNKLLTLLGVFHPTARKIFALYKRSDFVLCAPGGICMGGFQDWEHILFLLVAKAMKKSIVYYGRSIGPFPTETKQNRMFKKKSLDLLRYFSFLSFRDKKSMNLADSLNIKYEETVDSAFLETPNVDVPQNIVNLLGTKPYVVFVPNLLIWHYAYKGKVSLDGVLDFYEKIMNEIVSKYPNDNIVMLPQTFNYGTYDGDDINFFKDLERFTQHRNTIIVPDVYSSDVQQTIISKADCVIGARYHSVVFAINQAIPFVALSYEHKISGLLETLGKKNSMVDITSIFDSEENMRNAIEQFVKALDIASKDVGAQRKAKEIARKCFDKFICFYTKNFPSK